MKERLFSKRIDIIDALRGLAIVLMVVHHALFDMVEFLDMPEWLFTNPVFDVLHYIFAGLFVLLSGISSRFSRSNVKRGVKVFAIAMGMTLVTTFIDMPIRFGILHLLGFCMVFYGITAKIWDKIPRVIMPLLCIVLLVVTAVLTEYVKIDTKLLWMFGWTYPGFESYDYFPIFPWLFVFLLGAWAGKFIIGRKLPEWFYEKKIPFFPAIGRKSLIIYIVHQPILYGIFMAIEHFFLT